MWFTLFMYFPGEYSHNGNALHCHSVCHSPCNILNCHQLLK